MLSEGSIGDDDHAEQEADEADGAHEADGADGADEAVWEVVE